MSISVGPRTSIISHFSCDIWTFIIFICNFISIAIWTSIHLRTSSCVWTCIISIGYSITIRIRTTIHFSSTCFFWTGIFIIWNTITNQCQDNHQTLSIQVHQDKYLFYLKPHPHQNHLSRTNMLVQLHVEVGWLNPFRMHYALMYLN
ncbi:MAG: DUF986 family protein [Candidatus Marivariicella sp.]